MGKRGILGRKAEAPVLLIEAMQALAVILILSGSLAFVGNQLERVGYAKKFYARDYGLLLTAMNSIPENIGFSQDMQSSVNNVNPKHRFSISISDNIVSVSATESPGNFSYWHFSDLALNKVDASVKNMRGILSFYKQGNSIRVVNASGYIFRYPTITCDYAETSNKAWRGNTKLILDPAGGYHAGDLGLVNSADKSFNENSIALGIASSSSFGVGKETNVLLTRQASVSNSTATLEQRSEFIKNNADSNSIIISISTGSMQSSTTAYLKAYYNINSDEQTRKKSRKLGCLILNSILHKEGLLKVGYIQGLQVIASDSEKTDKILPPGKVGVILEIGNIQIPKNDNFLSQKEDLAGAIFSAVNEGYYGAK